MSGEEPTDLWLFGYGSLIFKPPPKFDLRVPGYIEGYVRRFWQVRKMRSADINAELSRTGKVSAGLRVVHKLIRGSEDHRGTPEDPGRVVTLIDRAHWESLTDQHTEAPTRVWGAAYRIPAKDATEMKEYLDIREINGYSMQYTPFFVSGKATKVTGHGASAQDLATVSSPIDCLVYIGLPNNPQFLGPQDPQALAEKIVRSRGPSGENVEYLLELQRALDDLSPDSGDDHITDLARRCHKILASRGVNSEAVAYVTSTDGREEVEK